MWIDKYVEKAQKYKKYGVIIIVCTLLFTVFAIAAGVFCGLTVDINMDPLVPVFVVIYLIWVFAPALFISLSLLLSQVVRQKYRGYTICFFIAPVKNYLIIEDELQSFGGPFQRRYYGQLPDGTSIVVKMGGFGKIRIIKE